MVSIGWSSKEIVPCFVSYNRAINSIIVDLPEPVLPKKATVSPTSAEKVIFFNAVILVSSYVKVTSLKFTFPFNKVGAVL